MFGFSIARCPYFKVDLRGAYCKSEEKLVKDIENANIKFCLCRNFERCCIYHVSLADFLKRHESQLFAYIA